MRFGQIITDFSYVWYLQLTYWKCTLRGCCPGVGHLYPIFKPHREAFAAFPKGQIPDKCPETWGGGEEMGMLGI